VERCGRDGQPRRSAGDAPTSATRTQRATQRADRGRGRSARRSVGCGRRARSTVIQRSLSGDSHQNFDALRVLAITDQCRDVRGQGGGYAVRANVRNEGDGEVLYWLSLRPLEQGRVALMRWDLLGQPEQVIDAPWDVRTGVCEYGGGAYVSVAGTTWFSNFADGRLYRVGRGSTPQPLTEPANYRFADLVLDRR